jgi:hypothetical protein
MCNHTDCHRKNTETERGAASGEGTRDWGIRVEMFSLHWLSFWMGYFCQTSFSFITYFKNIYNPTEEYYKEKKKTKKGTSQRRHRYSLLCGFAQQSSATGPGWREVGPQSALFRFFFFFEIGSHQLFVLAGFEPQSSLSQPLTQLLSWDCRCEPQAPGLFYILGVLKHK